MRNFLKETNSLSKFFFTVFFIFQVNLKADVPYYIDFKYILNQSKAGKQAQDYLKKKLSNGIKKIQSQEKSVQEEEQKIIKQKKVLSAEEYKKQVSQLRNKVANLQKQRNSLLESVAKQRAKARAELIKNLNPIINSYMKENNIKMVIDKKGILLADQSLDLTKKITDLLNDKLKSIKLD